MTKPSTKPAVALAARDTALEMARLSQPVEQKILDIDRTIVEFARSIESVTGHFSKAILMGKALACLHEKIDENVMQVVMWNMNRPMGFMTDRDGTKGPCYDVGTVKECMIQALLHGFYLVGNEWNIIAGKCYGAKNGWMRKLREVPGITDIRIAPGRVTTTPDGQTVVRVALTWRIRGVADGLRDHEGKPGRVFTIKTYGKEGPDAILGKAEAKAYRAAYIQATGSIRTLDDPDDEAVESSTIEGRVVASRVVDPAATLAQSPAAELTRQRERAFALARKLAFTEEDWAELSERLAVPGDLRLHNAEELTRVITLLEGELERADAESAAERKALAQEE